MTQIKFRTEMDFAYGEPRDLAPGVVRLVANNPSVFTYKGTNTYILGSDDLAIMDPGPDDDAHFEATIKAIAGRPVSHILITHTHHDHIEGLPRLAEATGAKVCGFGRAKPDDPGKKISPSGSEYFDGGFEPDIVLRHGDEVCGSDWGVEAVFTPGHAPDHLCFALHGPEAGQEPEFQDSILFSGDHVMGWNTSVVAPPEGNMKDYLDSLNTLIERKDHIYFPGHGGQIEKGGRVAHAYLVHRRLREQSIFEAIKGGQSNIAAIVSLIYRKLDPRLIRAASLSVEAHIEHLIDQGLITFEGTTIADAELALA